MISTNLRIDENLWKELKKIALEQERSVNGQINYIIKKYIEEQKEKED